jgi:hypothetical protein
VDCPTGKFEAVTSAVPLPLVVAGDVCPATVKETLRPLSGFPVPSLNSTANRMVSPKETELCPT